LNFEVSKITALLILVCFALPGPALAQVSTPPQTSSERKWEITDNSFLVEEAFNQERDVVQNILTWTRSRDGAWNASFTQEWPVPAMTHQLSYTLVYANNGDARGIGDTLVNYRYQLRKEDANGDPCIDKEGFARRVITYNTRDLPTRTEYFDNH